MGKGKDPEPRFVKPRLDGYYGGYRRAGGPGFWLADGAAEFSKRWMDDAKPSDEEKQAAPVVVDGGTASEQAAQIAELTGAAETAADELRKAEADRDAEKAKADAAERARAETAGELEKVRAELAALQSAGSAKADDAAKGGKQS